MDLSAEDTVERDEIMNAVKVVFLAAVIIVCAVGCGRDSGPYGDFPENPGYLRATSADFGKLVVFDADTFEIYRTVDVPRGRSQHIDKDDQGRVWIGYTQGMDTGIMPWMLKSETRVLSKEGELVHVIEKCAADAGVAFAAGYAFMGCRNHYVEVVDTESMEIVKSLEVQYPDLYVPRLNGLYIWAVEEVAGSILVIGTVSPASDYDSLTPQWSPVTIVARIDPDTLTVQDYKAELPPGSRVLDAVEVNGNAWLLNSLSHIPERPPRADIYLQWTPARSKSWTVSTCPVHFRSGPRLEATVMCMCITWTSFRSTIPSEIPA